MNIYSPVFIISIWKDSNSLEENRNNQLLLSKFLWKKGIEYNEIASCKQNNIGESFALYDEQIVQNIVDIYKEDYYMALDANRFATLNDHRGGLVQILGKLMSSIEQPEASDWLFDKINKLYYYY